MIRASMVLSILVVAASARADEPAPPPPIQPAPPAAQLKAPRPVEELLTVLQGDGPAAARREAADELARHGAEAIAVLKPFLRRDHKASSEMRGDVLRRIGADVPNDKGEFRQTKRKSDEEKEAKKRGELDWLAELLELPVDGPAVSETVADVAALRALAHAREPAAAEILFDVAFRKATIVYRDECGRLIRKMSPYSVAALIKPAAIERKYSEERRYATYQLERLDLEHPNKVLRAIAGDERFTAVMLRAYGEHHYRPAVDSVLANTNHESPVVRGAARDAWMAYVTGPAPPPAPRKKLQLTGGRLTDKEQPLWLNYREMAEISLERLYAQVLGKPRVEKDSLDKSSKELFAHYDQERTGKLSARVDAALARGEADPQAAAAELDAVLALEPDHPRRADMAPFFHGHGRRLAEAKEWTAAAAAFAKAHALDPAGEHAEDALASHFYALAHAREAEGKDGTPFLRKAREIQPTPSDETRAMAGGGGGRSRWMLLAGIGGGLGALLLLALGLAARRHHHT